MTHAVHQAAKPVALTGSSAFQSAVDALLSIQRGLAQALEELPGARRAADVERALGIDRPLAWRVFRTATASDAAQTLQYMPTSNQLTRVLGIARHRGVRPETVHAIVAALARFEESVLTVAEDRTAFGALLSGHIKEGLSPLELRVRRATFRGNAHLWGKQCRTLAFMVALQPNPDGRTMNSVTVRGWVDLHSSRPQHSTVLFSRFQIRREDNDSKPADDESRSGPLDLVRGFGTNGDSELLTIDGPDGRQETHVRLPGVGREGRVSLYLQQQIDAGAPIDEPMRMVHTVCTPAEALVFDLLIPAGWSEAEKAKALAYARPHDVSKTLERRSVDQIACYDDPMFIAGADNAPLTPDVPRWPELVEHVLNERGWAGAKFDVIRLRVAYPMLHSTIVLEAAPREKSVRVLSAPIIAGSANDTVDCVAR